MRIKFELDGEIVAEINSDAVPGVNELVVVNDEERSIQYVRWDIEKAHIALMNHYTVTVGLH